MGREKVTRLSEAQVRDVAARFRALSQPLRIRLIHELLAGEQNVTHLVKRTGANQSNVSKHLGELHKAKILGRRRDGLSIYYFVEDKTVFDLCDCVCRSNGGKSQR